MYSVDQPPGLLPQVQHLLIIWWSLVVGAVELIQDLTPDVVAAEPEVLELEQV
jgi:hypothetical protein